jgi:putative transposase
MRNTAKGTLMAKKGKHSKAEIAAKLAQAGDLATQGKLQSEIARTLGVSVMTLHRWRKMSLAPRAAAMGWSEPSQLDQAPRAGRIAELQLENSRLRRLVTDLLLEKMNLEEAFQVGKPSTRRASR